MADIRVYFTTDVHGSEVCFRKFLNSAKFYQAQVIVLGGDITGKAVVPLVDIGGGRVRVEGFGPPREVEPDDLPRVERQIQDSGSYPWRLAPDELQALRADPVLQEQLFRKAMVRSVARWLELAEERLRDTGIRCYIGPGNDDIPEIDAVLSSSRYVVNPEDQVVEIGEGWEMITSGVANPTPWQSPRELPEDLLYARIRPMAERVANPDRAIFGLHVPPVDTPLDEAPALDENLKPIVSAGAVRTAHVGSTAIRRLIEEFQPALGLHGHIHESKGTVRIGRTLCLNPGSEYGEGTLRGALVQLGPQGVKDHLFVAG